MNGPRPGDITGGITGDVTGDATGDNADWLQASLDNEPSSELKDVTAPDSARRPGVPEPRSIPEGSRDRSGLSAGRPDDDSASWERSVIGDTPSHDLTGEHHPQAAKAQNTGPTTPPVTRPNVSAQKSRNASKNATQPKPGDRAAPRQPRPVADTSTWSGRRRARRADKRLAEREAKALMHRRPLWRGRVVPKTVLGISFTMLVSGLAMAVSGTLLYMNFRYRQDQSDALVRNFPQQVRQAQRAVQNEGRNARSLIQDELEPLRKLAATAETLTTVLTTAEPSVWAVRTFDVDGQGTAGTAFVVASDDEKTFMVTSLSVVKASTAKPGPQILVRKGNNESAATLWTWDDKRDLALLVVTGLGNQPPLSWAAPTATRLGDQVFIMSGFGANDASIVEGRVGDVFADGIQHTAPIGTHFRGGPIIDSQGRVVAVASWNYAPLGFTSAGVFFAPPISAACEQVLRCLNNRVDGAGAQR